MYRFYINKINNDYHFSELARVFLPDDMFEVIAVDLDSFPAVRESKVILREGSYLVNLTGTSDRDEIKRELYGLLSDLTGLRPGWGTLTGVRPLKLALELYNQTGSLGGMEEELARRYLLSPSNISLLKEIADYQLTNLTEDPSSKVGIYVGIPFCPTRCEYCAFASNVAGEDEIAEYFLNLLREIRYTGALASDRGIRPESIYIGGGTPTTLNANQLRELVRTIGECFGIIPSSLEFTVEAGRPDTITSEKLYALREEGVSRISINPQSMKDETLEAIGRDHSSEDIRTGYRLASGFGFDVINADLIAGLPGEDIRDFTASLDEIIALGANNITVHTLSVKRGSRLRENDPEYYRRNTESVQQMMDYARSRLSGEGFVPYYIYRQKHQMGALENVGYCRPGKHSLYNIRIMEEKQTIIGLGAGAIGKVYFPEDDRLERIPNVSNYKVYNERFEEMLERKNKYFE